MQPDADRQFWLEFRRGLLMMVKAIDRRYKNAPVHIGYFSNVESPSAVHHDPVLTGYYPGEDVKRY